MDRLTIGVSFKLYNRLGLKENPAYNGVYLVNRGYLILITT